MRPNSWKLVAALGAAGLLLATGACYLWPQQYASTARLRITDGSGFDLLSKHFLSALVLRGSLLQDLVAKFDLYDYELREMPISDVIEKMRRDVVIDGERGAQYGFTLGFRYRDVQKAQAVTQVLVAEVLAKGRGEAMRRQIAAWTSRPNPACLARTALSEPREEQRFAIPLPMRKYGPAEWNLPSQCMFEDSHLEAAAVNFRLPSTIEQLTAPDIVSVPRAFPPSIFLWCGGLGMLAGFLIGQPWRRTWRLTGFALAGFLLVGAPMHLIPDRYASKIEFVLEGALKPAPPPEVKSEDILMPAQSPLRVYRLTAIRTDRAEALRAVTETISTVPFEGHYMGRPSPYVIESPDPKAAPIGPDRLTPALAGAGAALLFGIWRTRRAAVIAH